MFDIEKARAAGYTDKEIADFLGKEAGFNVDQARSSGYSDDEIVGHITRQKVEPVKAPSTEPPRKVENGFVRGLMDPINAGAQLLTKVIPDSWEQAGNKFNNWLVDQGAPLDRLPEGGLDQMLREDEATYQNYRKEQGDTGIDGTRLLGNVLSPANLAVASKVPQMATLGGRMAVNAAAGTGMGAMSAPVVEGDFWTEKAKQMATGGLTGAITPVATGMLSRVIKPKSSPEVQQLIKEGVNPTPGQTLGGAFQRTEDALTSMPLVGDAIKMGQKRSIMEFNKAAVNRALKPIGEQLPKNVEPGRQAITYADERLGKAYDDLLPNLVGRLDDQFQTEIVSLKKLAQSMPDTQKNQFNRILQNEVLDRFTSTGGLANGQTLKNIESKLGEISRGYGKAADYDQRTLGDAVQEVQATLRRMVERNNPDYGPQLKAVNQGWANFLRVQNAASRMGAHDGVFTPNQLRSATKSLDSSRNKSAFAKGKAPMQDLAESGASTLSQTVPDSGTPLRSLINLGALYGGYTVHPGTVAAAAGGSLPYTPIGQKVGAALLARRPDMAEPIAEAIKQSSPYLKPGLIPLTYGLLEE